MPADCNTQVGNNMLVGNMHTQVGSNMLIDYSNWVDCSILAANSNQVLSNRMVGSNTTIDCST